MKILGLTIGLWLGLIGLSTAEETGSLVVTSNVKNAKILLDGRETGQTTPAFFRNLPAKTYGVELLDVFGNRLQQKVAVTADDEAQVKLNFEVGALTVTANIAADTLFVNNVPLRQAQDGALRQTQDGALPQPVGPNQGVTLDNLPRGVYTLRVEPHGVPVEKTIYFNADHPESVQVQAEFGTLTVDASAAEAVIRLNGWNTGRRTPAIFTDLPAGVYEIVVTKGDKRATQTVRLNPNTENNVTLEFKKNRLWQYALLGVGTVGASTLTYLLTKPDDKKAPNDGIPGIPDLPK